MGGICYKGKIHSSFSPPSKLLINEILTQEPNKTTEILNEQITTSYCDITKVYKFDAKPLGNGHFGVVRLGSLLSNPSKKFAIKTIDKQKVKKELHLLKRELEILKILDHPNIVKFYETYQDENYFHLVMEYLSGGELLDKLIKNSFVPEKETKELMLKLFSAIKYLHDHGITHRDLKPENFLFSDKTKDAEIKIIDFGLSKQFDIKHEEANTAKALKTIVGTAFYVAPEVLHGKYDYRCDNWSLGVIAYTLLCGNPPFYGENNKEIFAKVIKGKFQFVASEWKSISKEAQDFISKLLCVNVDKRYTALQALNHNWLRSLKKKREEINLNPKIVESLAYYKDIPTLKKEAMKVIVNMMNDKDIKDLKNAFRKIDLDNSGMISYLELHKIMNEIGINYSEEETKLIVKTIKKGDETEINYSDFLAATIDKKVFTEKDKIKLAFKHFDIFDKNEISLASLKESMARNGRKINDSILEQWIMEVDNSKNGKISFKKFEELMRNDIDEKKLKSFNTYNESPIKNSQTNADFKASKTLFSKSFFTFFFFISKYMILEIEVEENTKNE